MGIGWSGSDRLRVHIDAQVYDRHLDVDGIVMIDTAEMRKLLSAHQRHLKYVAFYAKNKGI